MAEETTNTSESEHSESHAHQHNAAAQPQHEHHVHHEQHSHEREKFQPSKYKKHVLVTLLYLVVALVMFYQITLHITTVAPGTGADTYQNLWDVWWVKYAVFNLHSNVFYTHMLFWPVGASLAFQTLSPLLGLVSSPFQMLGGTVFGYNVMFFVGFALSGLCMFVLADYLTKNNYAALIAGFIFAFSAFHIAQSFSHIHYTNIEFIPLFLYFFLRVLNEKRSYLNIIGMSASFALTTLIGNIEQTIMLFLAFVLILVIYLFYKETRKRMISRNFVISLVLFVVLALVIGAWNFVPLIKAITQSGGLGIANYLNTPQTNAEWSASPLAFLLPSYYNGLIYHSGVPQWVYNSLYVPDPVEKVAYVGYVVIALLILAVYKYRKEMLPWAICAVVFAWLSLGPAFGLYSVYHAMPAINVIREPGRFDLMASLFVAIIGAYGAKALFEMFAPEHNKGRNGFALVMLVVILALMFVENNGMVIGASSPFTTAISVPKFYNEIANVPGNFSVLEIPALPAGFNNTYLYPGEETFYTSITKKPLVGGYLGGRQNITSTLLLYNIPLVIETTTLIDNGSAYYLSPVTENYTNQTLLTLYNYNTEFVTVHYGAFSQQELNQLLSYMESVFGNPVYQDNSTMAFQTAAAVNRTLFKSYVSYPSLTQWQSVGLFTNGTQETYWEPLGVASVIVYAPFASKSPTTDIYSTVAYINTTIRFTAFSRAPQSLYIGEPAGSNGTSLNTLAKIGITTSPVEYSVRIPLISGPTDNPLLFVSSYNNTPVYIKNLTFSRS